MIAYTPEQLDKIFHGNDFHYGNTRGIKKVVLLETFEYRCFYCGKLVDWGSATQDHLFPRSLGGKNSMENLVLSCRRCNKMKGERVPTQEECEMAYAMHVRYKQKQQTIDFKIYNKVRRLNAHRTKNGNPTRH